MSYYDFVKQPVDERRNTAYDKAIRTLLNRGFTAYQICKVLQNEGATIGQTTIYSRVKEIKTGKGYR